MILLKRLSTKSQQFGKLLSFKKRSNNFSFVSATFPPSYHQISVQKLLKLSKSKGFNQASEVKFSSLLFEIISKKKSLSQKEIESITKQADRIIRNSLKCIGELSITETLLLSNNFFEFYLDKQIVIDELLLLALIQKINKKIESDYLRAKNESVANLLVSYIKYLWRIRKLQTLEGQFEFLFHPENQKDFIEILGNLIKLNHLSNNQLFVLAQRLMQRQIVSKINTLSIESPLVNEIVINFFFAFGFQNKHPYLCLPQWVFILVRKLKQKHMKYIESVGSEKKVQFVRMYIKFLNNVHLQSQLNKVGVEDIQFGFYIISELCDIFQYIDENRMQEKIQSFIDQSEKCSKFITNNRRHNTYDLDGLYEKAFMGIIKRYFQANIGRLQQMQKESEKMYCKLLARCSQAYINLFKIDIQFSSKLESRVSKILEKTYSILFEKISKVNDSIQLLNYDYAFRLIPYMGFFSQKGGFSSIQSILSKTVNFVRENQNMFLAVATKYQTDLIVSIYFTCKLLNFRANHVSQIFQHLSSAIKSLTTKKWSYFAKINEQVCQEISLQVSHKLTTKLSVFCKQGSQFSNREQKSLLVQSLKDLFGLYSVSYKSPPLLLYKFWFKKSSPANCLWVNPSCPSFSHSWKALKTVVRYLNNFSQLYGLQFFIHVTRVGYNSTKIGYHRKKFESKIIQVFNHRVVNNFIEVRYDEITDYKYFWFVSYFALQASFLNPLFHGKSSEGQSPLRQKILQLATFCTTRKSRIDLQSQLTKSVCSLLKNLLSLQQHKNQFSIAFEKNSSSLFQILHFLNLMDQGSNFPAQPKIDISSFLTKMNSKLSNIQQYNFLLSFSSSQEKAKAAHDDFLSCEAQKLIGISEKQKQLRHIALESSSLPLKFYFVFIKKDQTDEEIFSSAQRIEGMEIFSNEEVLEYWFNKNIVKRTINYRLISAMVTRLIKSERQLTFDQFSTIYNIAVSLKAGGNNILSQEAPVRWVKQVFSSFFLLDPARYLAEYFSIQKQIPSLEQLQFDLEDSLCIAFKNSKICLIEHLYQNVFIFNKTKTFQSFIEMLISSQIRGLMCHYFDLQSSVEFRVRMLLIKSWGLVLLQKRLSKYEVLFSQFVHQVLANVQIEGIEDYLRQQKNKELMNSILLRYQLSKNEVSSRSESDIMVLLERLWKEEEKREERREFKDKLDRQLRNCYFFASQN